MSSTNPCVHMYICKQFGFSPKKRWQKVGSYGASSPAQASKKKKNWVANLFSHPVQFGICINRDQSSGSRSFPSPISLGMSGHGACYIHTSPTSGL